MKRILAIIFVAVIIVSPLQVFAASHSSGTVHTVERYTSFNERTHIFTCSECGLSIVETHRFNASGNCDCGYFIHNHSVAEYTSYNDRTHIFRCEKCRVSIVETHAFDSNGNCDCGYFTHGHSVGEYSYYNERNHIFKCEKCGVSVVETHRYDEEGKCVCGYSVHSQNVDEPNEGFLSVLLSFLELIADFFIMIINYIKNLI